MKVTKKQLEELTSRIFQNVQVVEDDADDVTTIDELISELDNNRLPILRDRIKDEMHKELTGKFSGSLKRQLIRQTGMSESDLSKFDKNEDAIAAAIAFKLSKVEGAQADVQKTIDELTANNASALETLKEEYEGKLLDQKRKLEKREIYEYVRSQTKDISIREGVDTDELVDIIVSKISNNNDISLGEDGNVSVTKKGSVAPALNKAGNALFSWKEAITDIITPLGCISTDTGGINPLNEMNKKNVIDTPSNGVHLNSLDSINKAVAAAYANK